MTLCKVLGDKDQRHLPGDRRGVRVVRVPSSTLHVRKCHDVAAIAVAMELTGGEGVR